VAIYQWVMQKICMSLLMDIYIMQVPFKVIQSAHSELQLSGVLTEIANSPYYVPSSIGKSKEEHAYLGLTGFDKNELTDKKNSNY
jgi:hypothetical protein